METNRQCQSLQLLINKVQRVEGRYKAMQEHVEHPTLKRKLSQFAKDRKRFKRGLQYCLKSLSDGQRNLTNRSAASKSMKLGRVEDSTQLHPSVVIKDAIHESGELAGTYAEVLRANAFPPRIAQLLINQKNKIKKQRATLSGFRNELGYVQA